MVEIHNLIQPGLEQIFLPALSTFFRSHPDIRCCFATSIESRHQRQINLQANLCPSRQNWQKRILTASENRFPLKRLRVLHGRLSRSFPTSQILTDLMLHFAASGVDVHVITSQQLYDDSSRQLPAKATTAQMRRFRAAERDPPRPT